MTPSYDRAPTRAAPAEERVAEPALREAPNSAAGDFASPREPGREAAERVLARDPLAGFYFDSLVTEPIEGVRKGALLAALVEVPGALGAPELAIASPDLTRQGGGQHEQRHAAHGAKKQSCANKSLKGPGHLAPYSYSVITSSYHHSTSVQGRS